MTTLTVALPLVRPTSSTEFGYALSDDGQTLQGHGSAPMALLPGASALVLVVPARCLSWFAVKLPPVAANRLRAALEGALEERLLDEPAHLALAVGPQRSAEGEALVAACDKAWLRAMLDFFELARRPVTRVVPEFAPTGGDAPQHRLAVTGTAEDARLVLVDAHSVVSAPLAAASVLLGAGAPHRDGENVLAEPAVAELAERVLSCSVTLQPPAQGLLASGRSAWELAQFDLAISSSGRMARRWGQAWQQFADAPAWRAARWGLALVLLANLVGLNAWAWRQEAALQAKRDQVKRLLSQTFPQVKTIVDAPLQMERELVRLRQSNGALSGRDLEVMLGAVGAALPAGNGAAGIDYSPGELVLKGLALGPAQVAAVNSKLAAQSYATRLDGERLVVRAGAAP